MLKSLRIKNFRCFKEFELQQLGRLNLLVGTNNSGKTSILEAVQLLKSHLALESLWEIMVGRGEYLIDEASRKRMLDIRHLFYGHKIDIGRDLIVADKNHHSEVRFSIENTEQLNLFENLQDLKLVIKWLGEDKGISENEDTIRDRIELPLSPEENITLDRIARVRRELKNPGVRTQFVTSASLTTNQMMDLFDQVVLTPEEDLITEALQTIEPSIMRIASVGSDRHSSSYSHSSRKGFVVRLSGRDQRIPIGSMGDGIWRILALTLAIVNAKNGVLLVDEIDTGLHFRAMSDMWNMIWKTAKRLDVQVFATTHSSDCWTSLATISDDKNISEEEITIQRIERDKLNSVVFTERQIAIAAERGIEVR